MSDNPTSRPPGFPGLRRPHHNPTLRPPGVIRLGRGRLPMAPGWSGSPPDLGVPPVTVVNAVAQKPETIVATVNAAYGPIALRFGLVNAGARIFARCVAFDRLILGVAWGRGPIDSVQQLLVDDQPAHASIVATHYTGTQTVADPTLVAAFAQQTPPRIYTDVLPGIAYSVLSVPPGVTKGFPRITAVLKGLKLYDPRILFYSVRKDLATGWADVGTPGYTANAFLARDGTQTAHKIQDLDEHPAIASGRRWTWAIPNDDWLRSFSMSLNKDAGATHQSGVGVAYSGGSVPLSYVVKLNLATGVATVHSGAGGSHVVIDRATHWEVIVRLANNLTGNTSFTATLYVQPA